MKTLKIITILMLLVFSVTTNSQDTSAVRAKTKKHQLKDKTEEVLIMSFGTGLLKTTDKDSANFNLNFRAGMGYWNRAIVFPIMINLAYVKELVSRNSLEQFDIYISSFFPIIAPKPGGIGITGGFGIGLSTGTYRNDEEEKVKLDNFICPMLTGNGGLIHLIDKYNAISLNGFYHLKKYRTMTGAELNYQHFFDL